MYKRSSLMQERMQQNRQSILHSARELIAYGGFKEASVQTIAERAGVSTGLVYRYFESKNKILIEVLSAAIRHEVEILNQIVKMDLSAKQKLEKSVATFVKRAMLSPQLAYSLIFEPVDSEMEHARFQSKQLIKQTIQEVLAEGKNNGTFTFEDINIAALGIVGAMTFVVIEPLNPSHNVVFDQAYIDHFVQQIADFCVNAVQRP